MDSNYKHRHRLGSLLALCLLVTSTTCALAGDTTTNGYFYLPGIGASGASERTTWFNTLETTDSVLKDVADKVDQDVTTTGTPTFTDLTISISRS